MEITLRHFGAYGDNPSSIIELTVKDGGSVIMVDVTDLNNKVDENLIHNLREIADELEKQNELVENKTKDYGSS